MKRKFYLSGEDELVPFTYEVHIENLQILLPNADLLAAGFSAIFTEDGLPSNNIQELFLTSCGKTQLGLALRYNISCN